MRMGEYGWVSQGREWERRWKRGGSGSGWDKGWVGSKDYH